MVNDVFYIIDASFISPDVKRFEIYAPRVAAYWSPGQFVIIRVDGEGERIPLTVTAVDRDQGTIFLVVQGVGATTRRLNQLGPTDRIADVVGPLGAPADVDRYGTVVVVGGGVGTAVALPIARALSDAGNRVIVVLGGRSADLVILVDEMESFADEVIVTTDDGSRGMQGMVTGPLSDLVDQGGVDRVVAAGPIPMMRAVADVTRAAAIPTVASVNPIMVDGTGMCGGCRVLVDGETRFACVDGPEFNAHQVDFDLLAARNTAYCEFERARLAEVEIG